MHSVGDHAHPLFGEDLNADSLRLAKKYGVSAACILRAGSPCLKNSGQTQYGGGITRKGRQLSDDPLQFRRLRQTLAQHGVRRCGVPEILEPGRKREAGGIEQREFLFDPDGEVVRSVEDLASGVEV